MVSDPHAVVHPDSNEHRILLALGWTVTDTCYPDDELHMEPPEGGSDIIVSNAPLNIVTPREPLLIKGDDVLIVTAEECDAKDIDALRQQIDHARETPGYCIISNFEIDCQVLRFED